MRYWSCTDDGRALKSPVIDRGISGEYGYRALGLLFHCDPTHITDETPCQDLQFCMRLTSQAMKQRRQKKFNYIKEETPKEERLNITKYDNNSQKRYENDKM
jgi:hypothetical protein